VAVSWVPELLLDRWLQLALDAICMIADLVTAGVQRC
jgi:hypothetical protein